MNENTLQHKAFQESEENQGRKDPKSLMCEYAYERLIIRLASSLAVQQLGLHALTVEDLGSIPGWGTKIPQAIQSSQKKESNYRVLSSNNKDYTILRCQAQPN